MDDVSIDGEVVRSRADRSESADQEDRDTSPAQDQAEYEAVVRATDGDVAACEFLIRRYQQPLMGLCQRMLRDSQEAQDVVQDTFVKMWHKLEALDDPRRFKSWLYRLASNACVDVIRQRERRRSTPLDSAEFEDYKRPRTSVEATVEARTAVRSLEDVVQKLPAEQRLAWILYEIEGESYAEVARILKTTTTSVRGRIYRARAAITEQMEAWL